jgi:hypothetical protein
MQHFRGNRGKEIKDEKIRNKKVNEKPSGIK